MKIRSIYLGESPIFRVYRNGKLRWDNSIHITGVAESNVNVLCITSLTPLEAKFIKSIALITSETDAFVRLFSASLMGVNEQLVVNNETFARAYSYDAGYAANDQHNILNTYSLTKAKSCSVGYAASDEPNILISYNYAEDFRCFNPSPIAAYGKPIIYASAGASMEDRSGMPIDAVGSNDVKINVIANLTLLNIVPSVDDTLEISSAYSASVTDGILEVI